MNSMIHRLFCVNGNDQNEDADVSCDANCYSHFSDFYNFYFKFHLLVYLNAQGLFSRYFINENC